MSQWYIGLLEETCLTVRDQFVRRSFFLLDPDTDIPSEDALHVFGATEKGIRS